MVICNIFHQEVRTYTFFFVAHENFPKTDQIMKQKLLTYKKAEIIPWILTDNEWSKAKNKFNRKHKLHKYRETKKKYTFETTVESLMKTRDISNILDSKGSGK